MHRVMEDKKLVFMSRGEYGYFFVPGLKVAKYHRNPIKISNNNIQVPNKCWLIHNTDFFYFIHLSLLSKPLV